MMSGNRVEGLFNQQVQAPVVQQVGASSLPAGIQIPSQISVQNPQTVAAIHQQAPTETVLNPNQITEAVNKLVEALKNFSRRDLQVIRGSNDPLATLINSFMLDIEPSVHLKQAKIELTKLLNTLNTGIVKQALSQYDKDNGQIQLTSSELKAVHQAVQESLTKAHAKPVDMQRMLENKDFNKQVLNEATVNYLVSLIQGTAHYQSLVEHSWIGPDRADLINIFKTFAQHYLTELNTKNQAPQNAFSFVNSRIQMSNSNQAELNKEAERLRQAGYTVKFENGQLSAEKQSNNSPVAVAPQVQAMPQTTAVNPAQNFSNN